MALRRPMRRLARDLSSRRRFASLRDWARWMTLSYWLRLRYGFDRPQGPVSIRFAGISGVVHLRPGTHDYAVAGEILLGDEYAFVKGLTLPPSPVVVDLGANIGVFLRQAHEVWNTGQYLAVEPEPGNFAMLTCNAEPLGTRATLLLAAVGDASGQTDLDRSRGTWATRIGAIGESGATPVVTMTDVLARYNLTRVDLLKCDIEGAEADLFRDCAAWIGGVGALIVEVHPPYTLDELSRDLARAGSSLRLMAVTRGKSTALLVT